MFYPGSGVDGEFEIGCGVQLESGEIVLEPNTTNVFSFDLGYILSQTGKSHMEVPTAPGKRAVGTRAVARKASAIDVDHGVGGAEGHER